MIRIEVPSDAVTREYEYKGQWYFEQEAAIFAGGHYPLPFQLNGKKGESYPKGTYTIDPKSFEVTERGKLVLGRLRLLPMNGAGK